jgi:GH25 family lysozyme M1 (1,4-beta-N-acetylmuramidase)/preprotein translocase subunit YajC
MSLAGLAQASTTSASSRSYGVDVSSYQPTSTTSYSKAGAQFVIVKVSEGTSYRNPNAKAQVASAKANNLLPMAYHFANFGSSSSRAKSEADYAIASAKAVKLPAGSYLAIDWETSSSNSTSGSKSANTSAIMAFMKKVKAAGYQPLLYSGAYLLNNAINTSTVKATYPNSLWVAYYTSSGRIDAPDFSYFPSMNGVIIWQFTENWKGLNVDGNISVLPLSINSSSSSSSLSSSSKTPASQAPVSKTEKKIMSKSYTYTSAGKKTGAYKSAYTYVYVIGGIVKIGSSNYYKIGTNQYIKVNNVDGTARKLVHNAWTYNSKGKRVKSVATLKKGKQVFTYGGKRKIGKKTYYRINVGRYIKAGNLSINSSSSSSSLSSSSKTPASQAPVSKTEKKIMSKSYIYTSAGKKTGAYKNAYTYVYVIGGIVKIGSSNYYKIGTNQYIKVNNVDGTARKLVHNAWTYNSKGKRVKSVATLKKGEQVFTYGGKRKIGKKTYYRINVGRYIKAGNVK